MIEIENLIDTLNYEEKIYSKILELANKKTEMIAEENTDEIENIAAQEEEYIKAARTLEHRREEQISKLEKSFQIEEVSDISSLLKYIKDEKLKIDLIETQKKFANTLGELKRVNIINNTLIQDALEYISLSLNLMTGATAEGTYGKSTGEMEPQTQHKSMFDFKG